MIQRIGNSLLLVSRVWNCFSSTCSRLNFCFCNYSEMFFQECFFSQPDTVLSSQIVFFQFGSILSLYRDSIVQSAKLLLFTQGVNLVSSLSIKIITSFQSEIEFISSQQPCNYLYTETSEILISATYQQVQMWFPLRSCHSISAPNHSTCILIT